MVVKHSLYPLRDLPESLKTRWREIVCTINANPSLDPGWTEITALSHNLLDKAQVLITNNTTDHDTFIPIFLTKSSFLGIPLNMMEVLGNVVSYHNQFVSCLDPDDVLEMLFYQSHSANCDVLKLSGIPDDSRLAQSIRSAEIDGICIKQCIPSETSPFLRIENTWNDLLSAKPKKFRYRVRKRAEGLSSSSELSMVWYTKISETPTLLKVMLEVERNSWKQDQGISINSKSQEQHYHELLLPFLAANDALMANVLYHSGKPIAYCLCCLWNGWMGHMKTSFDLSFQSISPGATVIDYALQRAFELRATEFDFLGDADPHKLAWSKDVRAHSDYFLYSKKTMLGNLIGHLKKLRNKVKRF